MKKVLLLLAKGFEAYEASVFTDVFGWSRVGKFKEPVDLVAASLHKEIKCTWNLTVKPEKTLNEINVDDFDALAIPGGFQRAGFYEDIFSEEYLELIREFDNQNKPIASVCVASIAVARSGALDNRRATTYDLMDGSDLKKLESYGVKVTCEGLVVDRNIISCTGPGYALDVAFKLLEMLTSHDNVLRVKEMMRIKK